METFRTFFDKDPETSASTDFIPVPLQQCFSVVHHAQHRLFGDALGDSMAKARRDKGAGAKKDASKGGSQTDLDLGLPALEQFYEVDSSYNASLGYGSGLQRYIHKKTKMPRAILSIKKTSVPSYMSAAEIDHQLQLLCKIDHPNIVPFRECCEDADHFRLIYEWCEGGLLIHQLSKYEGMLTEAHIAQVTREILSALVAANTFGVNHLDLGLFSIFLQYSDRLSPIRIFGFGLAGYMFDTVAHRKQSKSMKHYYASPELFGSSFKAMSLPMRHCSDVWSVGALLYMLCSGVPPFGGGSIQEVKPRILGGVWQFGLEFSEYSPVLKDLLEQMLKREWHKRVSATSALKNAWVSNTQTLHLRDGKMNSVALQQLNTYAQADHVKQTVARMLTDIGLGIDAYQDLEQKFREMDLNGDGTITLGELVQTASAMPGVTEAEVDMIVQKLDRNGNANVDINEFVAAMVMEQDEADERLIRKAFAKMDRNGDARVTKKELFTVLRQYSGSVETAEVSQFVGKQDKDGDDKIDYREFCSLFPQVKDKYAELNKRLYKARAVIQCGPKYAERYQENIGTWLKKIESLRDKLEVACGVRQLADHLAAGTNYSYERGHISEFDVQTMVKESVSTLRRVPGRNLTKAQKKAKVEKRKARETGGKHMIGLTLLSAAVSKKEDGADAGAEALQKLQRSGSGGLSGESGGESGSDNEERVRREVKNEKALTHAMRSIENDRKDRMGDPDYKPEGEIFDTLHWLIQTRSEFHWQVPLLDVIQTLQDACVEEVIHVTVSRKAELSKMRSVLTDKYVCREDAKFVDCNVFVHKTSRLLPLGSFQGKKLTSPVYLERMEEMSLPIHVYFGFTKEDVTRQKIEHMHAVHMEKLAWCGKFLTGVLGEIQGLFAEVAQDLEMCNTLESLVPSPPPMSHLYLKHCEGREIAEDAVTPRTDEASSEEEAMEDAPDKSMAMSMGMTGMSVASVGNSTAGPGLESAPSGNLPKAPSMTASMVNVTKGQKRIERNQVLTQTSQAAARVREGRKKGGKEKD